MEPQMNQSKPKRKYTRRYKRGKFADDEKSSVEPTGRSDKDHCSKASYKRKKEAGLPLRDSEWKRTSSGWQPPEREKIPAEQITRYFKITKIMEEIEQSEIPTFATVTPTVVANIDSAGFKERSELLKVPTLERSETIRL